MITDFFIPAAMAAEGATGGVSSFLGPDLFIIVAFGLVFYFIIWRPQSKRQKEHKDLVGGIDKGDEIVTTGGLIGKVVRVDEQFLVLEVTDKVELKIQKHAVAAALPKGTIKNI
ncbi:MAG TPA: preprotein translocase subunit YajC [Arenicellales bacterium]|jgi:preprotein translocase subunit YajC|nr:preprotein translocase subunit YajC [Gammaproteobacteria bacterium]MDP7452249.1 preprotein translocase subunit YajC [Arenicellales bacterium]HJL54007.1 preprotein translocase subunit YajC [Arenicellales bacterium]|tara:strand:+ start:2814 stop:3155 length:342 start_codon:yes stop_codon:yes gene_type:complete